jgi:cell division protein FtsB
VVLNFNLLKSSYESQKKLEQVSTQEDKVKDLEETNLNLKEELSKRDSPYFIEQEARNQLGYGKPGETTIVIQDQSLGAGGVKEEKQVKSNFLQWVELLKI